MGEVLGDILVFWRYFGDGDTLKLIEKMSKNEKNKENGIARVSPSPK